MDSEPLPIRPLRRVEYERLVAAGFFEEERVELLFGQIVNMSPQDPKHSSCIANLTMVLAAGLFGRAIVRVQLSFVASEISLPEPDVAVVPVGSHSQSHPSAAYFVIEVSNTSLRADRELKAALYAAAGVPEYWVVDVIGRTLERFTAPQNGSYSTSELFDVTQIVSPLQFPDLRVALADIF